MESIVESRTVVPELWPPVFLHTTSYAMDDHEFHSPYSGPIEQDANSEVKGKNLKISELYVSDLS